MIVTTIGEESELLTHFANVSIKQKINADYNLNFAVFNKKQPSYPLLQEEALIDIGDEQFVVKNIMDGPYSKSITAIHSFFECVHDFVDDGFPGGLYTIQEALNLAFSGSEWGYTVIGSFPQATLYNFGHDNTVALLNAIIEAWHVEYEVSVATKKIIIKQQLGVQTDSQIRYRHNLKTISRSINSENVKTAVKIYFNLDDYGDYQSSVIYYSPHNANYRRPKWAEPMYLDDVTSESEALVYARQHLKDTPDVTITAELIELKKAGYQTDEVQLGNSLYLIDERMSLSNLARIVEIERFPFDSSRSPIVTISTVRQNLMDAVVQRKVEQRQLEKTAVKQKTIYNGCTISKEDGFKATAENGIVAFLNATRGIAILNGEVYKFYVNPEGELILDGKLHITYNSKTMLEAYMDDNGGVVKVYDKNGTIDVALGSNWSSLNDTGGFLNIYADDGTTKDIRARLYVDKAGDGAGTLGLRHKHSSIDSVGMSAQVSSSLMFWLCDENDEFVTTLGTERGYIGNSQIITKALLDDEIADLKDWVRNELDDINQEIEWIWDEIDWLWSSMSSSED